jgi:uncharacterized protein (TIGR03437 family)
VKQLLRNCEKFLKRKSMLQPLRICLACGLGVAFAQTAPTVTGSDYSAPVPIFIAPGGLTTIYVQGIGATISQPIAATAVPLPTKLAGISVSLLQTESPKGPIPVPLLALFPVNSCRSSMFAPCGKLIGINLQIPFELVPNPNITDPHLSSTNYAQLVISEEGGAQATVEAVPQSDRIHVLRMGDTLTNPGAANINQVLAPPDPIVTHADGTSVTGAKPAKPGETVTLYAVGLGPVTPPVQSGVSTPSPAAVSLIYIVFDFNLKGEVSPHYPTLGDTPAFSGLTPGFVGLYQVNFVVPQLPPNYLISCGTELGSNLTVSIGRVKSFDGAKICVDVTGQH